MTDYDDDLQDYYIAHRAAVDTAADPTALFLLDYLQSYGPMRLFSLAADSGFGEEATERTIAALLERGMVEKDSISRLHLTEPGRRLVEEVLGNVQVVPKWPRVPAFLFRGPKMDRNDLIIGMTLAELFLLCLLVVWYGHTSSSKKVDVLEAQVKELQEYKGIALRASVEIASLKTQLEACRSHGKCEENNVLIKASVVNGSISVRPLRSAKFSQWMQDSGRSEPPYGRSITDRTQIETLLKNVADYYRDERKHGAECRFDYDMTYQTKEDYYIGRELFEHYFYPSVLSGMK